MNNLTNDNELKEMKVFLDKEVINNVIENFTLAATSAALLITEFKREGERFEKEGSPEGKKQCLELQFRFLSLYNTLMQTIHTAQLNR